MIAYSIHPLHEVLDKIEGRFERDYIETREQGADLQFEPDRDSYLAASHNGNCLVVMAWDDEKVAGYAIFIIQRSGRKKKTIKADNHGVYTLKEYRGQVDLIDKADEMLDRLGVAVTEYINDSKIFGRMMQRKGYKPVYTIWRKTHG